MSLFVGLMSGTSMDGIDAALVDVDSHTLIAGITRPYSSDAQAFIASVLSGKRTGLGVLSQLSTLLGQEFALAVQQLLRHACVNSHDVVAIGSHGQTICHDVTADIPYTIQLGCAHTIAALTGITVVADFRTRDLVVGGQGAPFAPLYHQALFAGLNSTIAVVNIGGIANVTYLAKDTDAAGYDVGPGNCLMDAWALQHLNLPYDSSGDWAASGRVIEPLLEALLNDTYFKKPSPKSIGKEYFSLPWLSTYLDSRFAPQDVQATLLALTGTSISQAIANHTRAFERLVICGGGAHNVTLLHDLSNRLPSLTVSSTQSLGVNPDFLEAMMFAWFAEKTLTGTSLDLSRITGAKRATILGAIYPGDKSNIVM